MYYTYIHAEVIFATCVHKYLVEKTAMHKGYHRLYSKIMDTLHKIFTCVP